MSEYITAIAALSIVGTVINMVIASESVKKYVKYILSLALLLTVLSPISPLLKKLPDTARQIGDFVGGYIEADPKVFSEMAEHSSSALENALESAVSEKFGVASEIEVYIERGEKNSAKISYAELTMKRRDLIYFDAVINFIEKTLNCEVKLIESE